MWTPLLACAAPGPYLPPPAQVPSNLLLVEAREHWLILDGPPDGAVRCVAADDPTDAHLAPFDELGSATVAGLRASVDLACEARAEPGGAVTALAVRTLDPSLAQPPTGRSGVQPVPGYTFVNHSPLVTSTAPATYLAWDPEGRLVWRFDDFPTQVGLASAVEVVAEGVLYGGGGAGEAGAIGVVDVRGEVIYGSPLVDRTWTHHADRLADGTWIGLAQTTDVSGVYEAPGFALVRWDPARGDEVVWEWRSQQAVDAGQLPLENGHANWFTLVDDGTGEAAWVSLCATQRLLRIDVATGDITLDLGAGESTLPLVDEGGVPLADDAWPQCQHGVDVTAEGPGRVRLLMVDNGRERGQSQVLELLVDEPAGSVQRTWTWTDPGWYSDILGDADVLDEHRVLVLTGTQGRPLGLPAAVVEVDRSTGEVWRLQLHDDDAATYRVARGDGCALFTSTAWCPERSDAARAWGW